MTHMQCSSIVRSRTWTRIVLYSCTLESKESLGITLANVDRFKKTSSSAVAKRLRAASCLYSFKTKRRAQYFIISCFGFIYTTAYNYTIKFFYVVFSSAYSSMLQAVTNKHSLVRRRLCDLHCMVVGNCFCHFVVRTSSNRSIASGAWPTVSYTRLCRR